MESHQGLSMILSSDYALHTECSPIYRLAILSSYLDQVSRGHEEGTPWH